MISVFRITKLGKIAICAGVIVVALFLSYSFYLILFGLPETKEVLQVAKKVETDAEFSASYVNTLAVQPDFFTEYRLEREKIRSERADLLREILNSAKTDETRLEVQQAILEMTLEKERESEMENLIKAKGFGDALVFIRDNSVNAVVKSASLSKDEVLQVADVIGMISGTKTENITVSSKP
jgi:stage III sporulation protein AH